MKSVKKAETLARDLKDRLQFRGFVITESRDGDGFPILSTDKNLTIAIRAVDMVSKDIFGNASFAFTPHVATISYASTSAPTVASILAATLEVGKMGMKITLTETVAPSSQDFEFDVIWPTKGM
jgi:hypothetical protein